MSRNPTGSGWAAALVYWLLATQAIDCQETSLFPALEPRETGMLRVSSVHELYWEESGNAHGVPVVVLHGGPGGKASPVLRRLFDPDRFRIVLFDQRGSGRSRPFAEWRDNRTELLVQDIEVLRKHLDLGPRVTVFGLSWGTTLALAYSQAHPDRVSGLLLAGVFLCTPQEIEQVYGGVSRLFYPERYERLRALLSDPDEGSAPQQLFEVISGDDSDGARLTAETFVAYEESLSSLDGSWEAALEEAREEESRSLAVLENHYLANGCFFEEPDQLQRGLSKIETIPTAIVNGRYDLLTPPVTAYRLADSFETARLDIIEAAGHVDLGVALGVVEAGDWLLEQVRHGEEP